MNQIENTTSQPQQQALQSSSSDSEDEFVHNIRKQLQNMDEEERSSRIISKNEAIPKPTAIQLNETREERENRFKYNEVKGNSKQIGKIEMITKENIIISSILLDFVINLDQLLMTKDMEIIGVVDDVFGKVEKPHYSVFLDGYNKKLIEDGLIKVEDAVFVNLDGASILDQITIKSLMNKKGCDASNQFDEEILNQFEIEYSDDESEIQHKHKSKKEDGELKHKNHKKQKQNEQKQKNYQNDYQQKHQHQHQHQPQQQQQHQQAIYNQQINNKPQQPQQQNYGPPPQLSQQQQIYLAQQQQLFQMQIQQQQQYFMQMQLQQQQQQQQQLQQQQQQQYQPFQQQQGQQHQTQQFQFNLPLQQDQIPQYQTNAILQSINPNVQNSQNQSNNQDQTQ